MTGQRKSVKIFGAIELCKARFHYRQDTVFNASTYFAFLEQLARSYRRQGALLIQDNATYHKDGDVWAWFDANRHWLEVHQLPPYSPELNPTERLWRYTRQTGTHNRYFPDEKELTGTLSRVFGEMQTYPELIRPYLHFFCDHHVSLFMRACIFQRQRVIDWIFTRGPIHATTPTVHSSISASDHYPLSVVLSFA